MKNLRVLSDDSLISETKALVREERRISLALLEHLREMDRRRLYATLGFTSLYEYVTRELGYSEAAAQRRIQSARLLAECPELAPRIESGDLSLTVLSQAQSFFRREEIRDAGEKREILKTLENESARGAERKLMALATEPALHVPEKVRPVSDSFSEVRFTADSRLLEQIEELKNFLGEPSIREVLGVAVKVALEKLKPKAPRTDRVVVSIESAELQQMPVPQPSSDSAFGNPPPAPEVGSRYIGAETRRVVWARDGGQCTHRDPSSGRRCSSRFGLELDHLRPHALGGSNQPENLALKCRAHNQLAAVQVFGVRKVGRYVPSLN